MGHLSENQVEEILYLAESKGLRRELIEMVSKEKVKGDNVGVLELYVRFWGELSKRSS